MMDERKFWAMLLALKYWRYSDEMRELSIICRDPEGISMYKRSALRWKTKALIVESDLIDI